MLKLLTSTRALEKYRQAPNPESHTTVGLLSSAGAPPCENGSTSSWTLITFKARGLSSFSSTQRLQSDGHTAGPSALGCKDRFLAVKSQLPTPGCLTGLPKWLEGMPAVRAFKVDYNSY